MHVPAHAAVCRVGFNDPPLVQDPFFVGLVHSHPTLHKPAREGGLGGGGGQASTPHQSSMCRHVSCTLPCFPNPCMQPIPNMPLAVKTLMLALWTTMTGYQSIKVAR